jgi:hypothetical protein
MMVGKFYKILSLKLKDVVVPEVRVHLRGTNYCPP